LSNNPLIFIDLKQSLPHFYPFLPFGRLFGLAGVGQATASGTLSVLPLPASAFEALLSRTACVMHPDSSHSSDTSDSVGPDTFMGKYFIPQIVCTVSSTGRRVTAVPLHSAGLSSV
jgi:hypothetical protein